MNETINLYRFSDLTQQAEFLYECVEKTVLETLPKEVEYLQHYDQRFSFINNYLDIPDKVIYMLIRFLEQNNGTLSQRARKKEFSLLTGQEVMMIESKYKDIFSESLFEN